MPTFTLLTNPSAIVREPSVRFSVLIYRWQAVNPVKHEKYCYNGYSRGEYCSEIANRWTIEKSQ